MKIFEELEIFMFKYGENIIDILGVEVDRFEKELKKWNFEVWYVDLEILWVWWNELFGWGFWK